MLVVEIAEHDFGIRRILHVRHKLAKLNVTGGNIRNVALAAAFLAADEGEVVRMSHLIHATQREYQKTGKLLRDHDFPERSSK